jgi:hypothetical protein
MAENIYAEDMPIEKKEHKPGFIERKYSEFKARQEQARLEKAERDAIYHEQYKKSVAEQMAERAKERAMTTPFSEKVGKFVNAYNKSQFKRKAYQAPKQAMPKIRVVRQAGMQQPQQQVSFGSQLSFGQFTHPPLPLAGAKGKLKGFDL